MASKMQQYTNVCNTSTTSRQLLLVENVSNETWCCYQGYENKTQANKFPTFIHLKPEEHIALYKNDKIIIDM